PAQAAPVALGGFHPAENCADCHADIVAQWRESMHHHAVTSPVTIVQTNQVYRQNLLNEDSPDPQLICNNCHAPVGVLLTGQDIATLPLPEVNTYATNDGIDCATCHQFTGTPTDGLAGSATYQDDLRPGRVFVGGLEDPVGNSYHQSQHNPRFDAPETTCKSCHNVMLDRNGDGRNDDAGIDLVLQTTFREFEQEYAGTETCVTCHMPLTSSTRLAETAGIPRQQDHTAPPREVRSHAFVGVDYPLDTVSISDPQKADRAALLKSAAIFSIDETSGLFADDQFSFDVLIDNNNLGHKLPTGFAFARQMWVEIIVTDSAGNEIFTSGVLATPTDDLCDTETLTDAMAEFVIGCDAPDPQLVNLQQKLVDDVAALRDAGGNLVRDDYGNTIGIQAPTGKETPLQNLNGGAVARTRPSDGQVLARISPTNDQRRFTYTIDLSDVE
ncbi:MAG: multiheme c-type cytochrome, partial [Planctomycetota bacterium]